MTDKRKKKTVKEKRAATRATSERRRLKKLANEGRLANGVEMPPGAIAADLSQQAPNSTCSPPFFYRDIDFKCVDCGTEEVWTAKNQKWYFEVVKGPVYGLPKRCVACRKKVREMKVDQRKRMKEADRKRRERERGGK